MVNPIKLRTENNQQNIKREGEKYNHIVSGFEINFILTLQRILKNTKVIA